VTTGKNGTHKPSLAIISSSLVNGKPISCSIDKPGNVTLDLFALNGAKIGILIQKRVTTAGCHSFEWNGQTISGKHIGNTAGILRLSSPNGTVSRMVYKMSK
jgi:hypothetical protein